MIHLDEDAMGKKNKVKKKLIFFLLFLALATLYLAGEIYISYNWLKTTEYRVVSSDIEEPVTICLLADLHDHRFRNKNSELVEQVRETEPDLILLAGDFINEDSPDTSIATELILQLTDIAPVYFSIGNQELGYMKAGNTDLLRKLEEAGACILEEEFTDIDVNGNRIRLGGMYGYAFAHDGGGHMYKEGIPSGRLQFLEEFQKGKGFKIMMSHRPDSFIFGEAAETWDIDMVLSGHLHGGQVILPFWGGLYAGDQGFFPEYVHGEHHFSAVKTMIISSGLGSDREKLPRFNNLPEVVKITLVHGE